MPSKSLVDKTLCQNHLRVPTDKSSKYVNLHSAQKVTHGCSWISTNARKRPTGHITIQVTVTDTHLPIVEQHYPQFLTLKKISQIPITYARPSRRGQQFSFTNPVYSKTATLHPHTMAPTTSRKLTHTMFRHHPSLSVLSTRTRRISSLANLRTRRRLRCGHI
jgi:hypothetical protein